MSIEILNLTKTTCKLSEKYHSQSMFYKIYHFLEKKNKTLGCTPMSKTTQSSRGKLKIDTDTFSFLRIKTLLKKKKKKTEYSGPSL